MVEDIGLIMIALSSPSMASPAFQIHEVSSKVTKGGHT
jgi:hypothetical protein